MNKSPVHCKANTGRQLLTSTPRANLNSFISLTVSCAGKKMEQALVENAKSITKADEEV